ncbi:hypothetical protein [Haliscomenobacter hydrossis]|uniref:Uncharacterized protein n=1 Tax=Haliscomenobacter hydrossis (strain ATCC 27775 / DSM 1100 / LMG 10767 / O) TaxID=760192 RepID=F4KZ84_HALH1|nr:hypothetical protein [Haliscomenobacter hydrossis]AEE53738.1 hypothetical protein Halhy_5915 [Haliscomenobacter hydrossis DSM 1100]
MIERVKNFALDRTANFRVHYVQTPEKPDVRVVAQEAGVPPPVMPKKANPRLEKKRQIWTTVAISVGVALLLVLAVRAKVIKL